MVRTSVILVHLCDAVEGGELSHTLLEIVPVNAKRCSDDQNCSDDVKCFGHCVLLCPNS
jgi:hypothetical protein